MDSWDDALDLLEGEELGTREGWLEGWLDGCDDALGLLEGTTVGP